MGQKSHKAEDVDIQSYSFKTFESSESINPPHEVRKYELAQINDVLKNNNKHQKKLAIERVVAHKKEFKISPIVLEHRGIKRKEQEEAEKKVQDEVEKRVQAIQEEAMIKGHAEGVKIGQEEVYNQTRSQTEEKLGALSAMIDEVLKQKEEILNEQKQQIYQLIKNLTKWIILRELDNDGRYLERLLEKLIIEMQSRSNIFIQVSQKDFLKMPEVLETVQKKIGELANVRIEVDYDIQDQGIVLECENGIIKGTIAEQFNSLDKLFESVVRK